MRSKKMKLKNFEENVTNFKKWLNVTYNYQMNPQALELFYECYKNKEAFHFNEWADEKQLYLKFCPVGVEDIKLFYQITDVDPIEDSWLPVPEFASEEEEQAQPFYVSQLLRKLMYDTLPVNKTVKK